MSIEVPRPDKKSGLCPPSVGKIFVKFNDIKTSKIAKKAIGGKIYNRKTCVVSFYPEQFYDIRNFNFTG